MRRRVAAVRPDHTHSIAAGRAAGSSIDAAEVLDGAGGSHFGLLTRQLGMMLDYLRGRSAGQFSRGSRRSRRDFRTIQEDAVGEAQRSNPT